MKNTANVICVAIILSVSGLTSSAAAQVIGTSYTYTPNHPVSEINSIGGGNTAGSYAAASMMGARGHSNYVAPSNWESTIESSCAANSGATLWPASCNPAGMATAVQGVTGQTWITLTYAETNQSAALNEVVASLATYHSPAVIPIYGQADHWVAVTQVIAKYNGSSTWTIQQVKAYDGGSSANVDSSYNGYFDALQSWGGATFANIYYKVLTAINPSCDPNCTSDPYYKKFVLTFEPPPGAAPSSALNHFSKAPGVIVAGQHMNEQIAQMRVWDALISSGIDADPQIWNTVQGGVPGAAWQVNGLWPSGAQWDYYLVPILSNTTTAIAFVQLAADDGSFQGISVPTSPMRFTPQTMPQAEKLARGVLANGEHLTGGMLTWDPSSNAQIAKSPISPYYEFGIVSPANKDAGVVRVTLNDNTVVRSQ